MLENSAEKVAEFVKAYGWKGPCYAISAISGAGCKELVYAIMDHVEAVNAQALADAEAEKAALELERAAQKLARQEKHAAQELARQAKLANQE
jgi:GTP-binding protein